MKHVADHTSEIINALDKKQVEMGHSTGGSLAQMAAGQGLSAATVAIDPGVFRGVLPLPASVLRTAGPFLVNPLTRDRAITLTFDEFKYGWANALDEKEAKELYDTFHVAGAGISLAQMGNANLNPWTESKVTTRHAVHEESDRRYRGRRLPLHQRALRPRRLFAFSGGHTGPPFSGGDYTDIIYVTSTPILADPIGGNPMGWSTGAFNTAAATSSVTGEVWCADLTQ